MPLVQKLITDFFKLLPSSKVLVITSNSQYIAKTRSQLQSRDINLATEIYAQANLNAEELKNLYVKHKPDLIIFDPVLLVKNPKMIGVCYEFNKNNFINIVVGILEKYVKDEYKYTEEAIHNEIKDFIDRISESNQIDIQPNKMSAEEWRKFFSNESVAGLRYFLFACTLKQLRVRWPPCFHVEASSEQTETILNGCLTVHNFSGMLSVRTQNQAINFVSDELTSTHNADICSVGKLFAVLGCYLAKIDINKPINIHPKILEKLPQYIQDRISKDQITPKILMFHLGGLGDYIKHFGELDAKQREELCLKINTRQCDLIKLLEDELNTGAKLNEYSYSNTGYFLLGLAIETAINPGKNPDDPEWKGYYQFVSENILQNAQMRNTSYIPDARTVQNALILDPLPCTSAGGWYSSAEDLFKLMSWVKTQCEIDAGLDKYIRGYAKGHVLQHRGYLPGAFAYVSLNLNSSDIFSVVTNSESSSELLEWLNSAGLHQVMNSNLPEDLQTIADKLYEPREIKLTQFPKYQ